MTQANTFPLMQFTLNPTNISKFAPRTGTVLLKRATTPEPTCAISIPTPNFLTPTSRGVIPHLSRDHHNRTEAIRWGNIPFESFLDRNPPIPTLQHGNEPLHTFLGFKPEKHVLSMTIRDPSDDRDMPPNGNNHISAYCLRGVRKISPSDWRSYILACQPDIVVALPDIPYTNPPYSQKRLTKSIDRTSRWLAEMLRPIPLAKDTSDPPIYRPNVLVHMAGGTSIAARRVFADSLLEKLYGKEADQVAPLRCLDDGVIGYTFDLVPLRLSIQAEGKKAADCSSPSPSATPEPSSVADTPTAQGPASQDLASTALTSYHEQLIPLLQASLESLPVSKLRIANTATSPHEMLRLIQSAGIDLFDAHFAQCAAQIGIALDFAFPAPYAPATAAPRLRDNGKLDIGHNLYDSRYSLDFSCFASCFSPASSLASSSTPNGTISTSSTQPVLPVCPCSACSPVPPRTRICHGPPELESESEPKETVGYRPPYTRAYIHHLLHTHEMSAHSLLVMHNLTVLDAFFAGMRTVIDAASKDDGDVDAFNREVERFIQTYDEDMVLFQEGTMNWRNVDLARGKGRLERERKKAENGSCVLDEA